MTDAIFLDRERKKTLLRAAIALAILLFIAGWLSALVFMPSERGREDAPPKIPVPADPVAESPETKIPDARPVRPADLRKTEKLNRVLRLIFSMPETSEKFGFTVLADGFWNEKTGNSLIRSFAVAQDQNGHQHISYVVLAEIIPEKATAREYASALKAQGHESVYILPVSESDAPESFAVMLGDYDTSADAVTKAEQFRADAPETPAPLVAYISPISEKRLSAYAIPIQAERPPVLPPYAIRLASYRSLESARKGIFRFSRNGLSVYIVEDRSGKKVWWRIFMGRYATAEEAKQARKENFAKIRKATGRSDAMVEKMPADDLAWSVVEEIPATER
ncbi:hypothetical protein DENIS_3091 [Desulfonema ishimotonii]|uniref:SPOR domain-containing protein n=1 Tax=Desulfonema ishimotonii TaxID=45657 RepID=A0A401FYT0_9BACT|nr:SPOR domain-containing protein [Desulfonema ishimotonii]GBC62128.1 hypothetical protein DENIS_3091 [Desulfonema ishimotonii]